MKIVPVLKKEKFEDAKEILDKEKINYKEEKEFSLFIRRGRVIRTEPEEGSEIKNSDEVTVYVSKLWLFPFLLFFIVLILLMFINIGISSIITNNRPLIESKEDGWVKSNIVYVKKDVDVSELESYMYCVTENKSSKKCDWKETQEKSIEIAETGKWNVFFKGKYKNGKYSFVSNKEEVLIDNISPMIDSITKSVTANSFNINVKASDKDSGIKNYYYKIGNKDYVEVKNSFIIKNLEENTEYTITVKVFDNALNSYEVTFKEKTSSFNNGSSNSENNNDNLNEENTTNKSEIDNPNYNNGTTVYPDSNPDKTKPTGNLDEENNTTRPIKTTTTSSNSDKSTTTKPVSSTEQTKTVKPTNTTKPVEPELEIPKIDLIDLPAVFEYSEKYQLPSHVEFGPSGGNYSCALDHDWSKNVSSTEDFAVGEYTVSCKAISNTGTYAEVSKDIKVIVPNGEDEEWDGWIRLNIYYPVGSTNREWRLHREGEIRGEDDDWESYTGPILVKVSDIGNIYIRYDLDGEKVIDVPNGKVLVDISADKMTLSGEETTNVKITYDKNAKTKEYRINGGNWTQYEKEFSVGADTLIEARATKEENVYDTDGNVIMQKTLVGENALYISEKGESVRIDINPDKEYLNENEKTNVSIDYEDDAIVRMYKVDDSAWLDYTGSFVVSANSTVYAYAESERTIDLDNGVKRTGKAVGRTQKTIFKSGEDNPEENYLHVNIKSSHNRLLKGQKATISIVSNEANSKIYYSLDNKNYTLYTNSFEVSANTFIYAKAEYKGKYAYDVKYIEAVSLSDRLEGPVISVSPTTLTEKVAVDIKTKEEAKNIYYSVDGGAYQEYVNTFEVLKNSIIRSYYINKNDKKSEVTYYYVQNIKQPNKPYVKIDASPSIYLNEDIDSVIVTISGSDYDTLEYSFNGIEYFRYERPIQINQSKSIYAKGTNKNGTTIEKLNITTSIAPIPLEKLDVAITLSPEENEVQGLIDKLEVSILYDERATGRYYRIGNGDLREYNGPFEITENTTVYAYALNTKGLGETSKQVNYLTTGISNPLIRINPTTPSPWVRVEIEYANTASIKKYKLDDGEWLDYFGPIELITNNTRISAYNEDSLGHYGESEILVDNIIPKDNLTVLDNGMYYLIKLNYPTMSNPSDREYKWKKDGEWKKYNPHGIVLIRPEYKDKVIGSDGVKIKDENGKEIIIKDDYYVLDVPLSELSENIFMRWDLAKPNTPTFILSTEEWTKEVTVAINYDKVSVEKLYKIIYSDGEETDWLDYKNPIKISKEDATIYAKSINDVEIQSEIASKRITNIDVTKPEIIDVNILEKGSSNFTIEVLAEDQSSKVDTYMYSLDGEEYITSKNNAYTFNKLKNNKEYQVYIKVTDKAGNISDAYQVSVTTTDIGDISYILDKEGWATEKELTISYPRDVYNGYSYQYSLDLGVSWELYEQPLKITENNTIVVARVLDGDNIKVAASFTVSKIDKTIPTISLDGLPSIFSKDLEYVIPTSYTDGISGSNRVCKVPNSDVEYTNSSSLPVGEYTLTCEITTGAGLTAQVSKDIKVTNITVKGNSILDIIETKDLKSGYYDFEVLGTSVIYPVHMYVIEGDQRWSSDQIFGDAGDVATKNDNAQNMVVVKVKGNVTIEEGVTVRPYYDELYGGPKGFTMYVTGKLENNGTIDNSHGAKAEGQDVYLWKNADGTYEYVPATGGAGGSSVGNESSGRKGNDGIGRQTGGGASGGIMGNGTSGSGGAGTSYSGGTGGGGGWNSSGASGSPNGSSGGAGEGGGTGNPGGTSSNSDRKGTNGTGGLLVLYADEYKNNGKITASGTSGRYRGYGSGGSSGGGSINIFTNQETGIDQLGIITNSRYNEMLGVASKNGGSKNEEDNRGGGAGGNGTISIGEVRNGTYYDLKDIIEQDKEAYKNSVTKTGDSILSIINEDIRSGYWFFKVNNEEYPVHMYVIEGDQRWSSDQIFGDAGDVATKNDNAQNMVVVKVKGNVTIEEGVTVRPYYDELYGGPKGFTMYVTGKLENNGTIDNSHGAKAEGQDVYLWKNADGTYEYVPATGGAGGSSVGNESSGRKGNDGIGRQTGGGASGGIMGNGTSGSGGAGTSYSGGTGGGGGWNSSGASGSPNGSSGGAGEGGGTGNPGGTSSNSDRKGTNGTGGLLVLYADEYKNNGKITASGTSGRYRGYGSGGSSGGGSINIFTNQETGIDQLGIINVMGGSKNEEDNRGGGAGGNGTATATQITLQPTSMVYSELIDVNNVQAPKFHIDSLELSSTKEITINYPSGFINEYSLDLGQTWILYKEPIKIDKNLTIIARTRSLDNVLSAASFTVTKIISEKEDSILEFYQGDDYLIPNACLIDDKYYKNIKDLETGSYKLVCGSESKQIIIKKKEEITSMEVD